MRKSGWLRERKSKVIPTVVSGHTRVYGQSEIGFGIVNWKLKKVWSLSFPEWFRIFVPKENVSTGNKLIFSRDIFRPRSRLPTEKTLMLNKPSSRLNINKNTLGPSVLMKLILEGKFKNKTQMIHFQIYSIRRLS